MVLKKQTVWLLTMLSLVVVLSVYYVTSPDQTGQYAVNEKVQENKEQAQPMGNEQSQSEDVEVTIEEMKEGTVTSSMSTDELFTALRMEIDEQRAKLTEDLQAVVASTNVTAEEKSEALDKIQELHTMATKEDILEQLIRADEKYADALVRAEEDKVRVIVKANELTGKEANEIMNLVRNEMGNTEVAVEFQPVK